MRVRAEASPETTSAAPGPIAAAERLVAVDVLRGFALFGILMVNMVSFKSTVFGLPRDEGLLNVIATWIINFAFVTKFYVLFSFLFGYGLSVQMERAAAKGAAIAPRFRRRLLGLLILGLAHGLLLYTGDGPGGWFGGALRDHRRRGCAPGSRRR